MWDFPRTLDFWLPLTVIAALPIGKGIQGLVLKLMGAMYGGDLFQGCGKFGGVSSVNDYIRFVICTAVGFRVGILRISACSQDCHTEAAVHLGGTGRCSSRRARGIMMTLTRLRELPFADWWVPMLFSAVLAVSLQKTLADMLEHGRPPDV